MPMGVLFFYSHGVAYCYAILLGCISIIPTAWASALLVLDLMGNARALSCGNEQQGMHPRFFCIYHNQNKFLNG